MKSYYIEENLKVNVSEEDNTYTVDEPTLDSDEKELFEALKQTLDLTPFFEETDLEIGRKVTAEFVLYNKIDELVDHEDRLTADILYKLKKYYLEHYFIMPFLKDQNVTKITVTLEEIKLQHRLVNDTVKANIDYTKDDLARVVIQLFQKAGGQITQVQSPQEIEYNDLYISASIKEPLRLEIKKQTS